MIIKMIVKKFLVFFLAKPFEKISIKKITKKHIISFDVFNTLILRKTKKPSDVFMQINDGTVFGMKRISAEKKARSCNVKEDVTLSDIYKFLPEYDENKEIKKEIELCYANPKAIQLYNTLRKRGKEIIIVSDMYLPREVICIILKNSGYDIDDVPIYVSSEYGKTKRTGNLYKVVLKDHQGQRIVHIGDNVISDYLIPKLLGIEAILCSSK